MLERLCHLRLDVKKKERECEKRLRIYTFIRAMCYFVASLERLVSELTVDTCFLPAFFERSDALRSVNGLLRCELVEMHETPRVGGAFTQEYRN